MSKALTQAVPAFACWPASWDLDRSAIVQAGLESNQGKGMAPIAVVALGHRPGMRVALETPKSPPDPLELGQVIEADFRATLAFDISVHSDAGAPVLGQAVGKAWSFASGKVVFSSPRTGHLLLQVRHGKHDIPSFEAAGGMLWIPVTVLQLAGASLDGLTLSRVALTVTPLAMMQLRTQRTDTEGAQIIADEQLQWLQGLGKFDSNQALSFLSNVVLCDTYAGQMTDDEFVVSLGSAFPACPSGAAPACRCVWVSGLPGCGALDVAAPLAKVLGAPLIDLAVMTNRGADLFVEDSEAAMATLTKTLKDHAVGHGIVVVCDVLCAPAQVLLNSSFAQAFVVTHVISVVEPAIFYPWGSARHPLALSRTHRGWVTAALVRDYKQASSGLDVRDWNALAKRCLHELKACRGSAVTLQGARTGSLIDGPLQELPASVALRSLALPGSFQREKMQSVSELCNPAYSLVGIYIATTVPFDLQALREYCNNCLELAAQEACPLEGGRSVPVMSGLFCIEAHVQGVDAQALWALPVKELMTEFQPGSNISSCRFVLTAKGEVGMPAHLSNPLAEFCGLIWWWCVPKDGGKNIYPQLRAEAEQFIDACRLRPPPPDTLWTRADVPVDQVARLEAEAQAGGLPDGCFSDGTGYIDVDGNKYKDHPGSARLVEAFIAKHNAEVEGKNMVIREIAALPVFTSS